MSWSRIRARLDRLEKLAKSKKRKNKVRTCDFTIDPALAKALRDDRKRLDQLELDRRSTGTGTEEERTLRARIAERASTINCPADYGFNEMWDDRVRLSALRFGKSEPWCADIIYNVDDPDAEEAQLIARIEAFNQSPEGRARSRREELSDRSRSVWMCAADHCELINLVSRYPEPPFHPKDPAIIFSSSWDTLDERKRCAQSDKDLFESTNSRRRRSGLREITENEASLAALELEQELKERRRQLQNHPDPNSEEASDLQIQLWLTIARRVLPMQRQ